MLARLTMKRTRLRIFEKGLLVFIALFGIVLCGVNFFLLHGLDHEAIAADVSVRATTRSKQLSTNPSNPEAGKADVSVRATTRSKQLPTNPSNPEAGKEPLLKTLRDAGVVNATRFASRLPTWQQVIDRFGSSPKMIGMDTCQAFRDAVTSKHRVVAPAGPFNSGTNYLSASLANCKIPGARGKTRGMYWQVN
jgi:hypothetical protein